MKPQLRLEEGDLRKRYLQRSREVHPDFQTLNPEDQQQAAVRDASYNNRAYETLRHFDRRLHYVLEMHEALPEEGKALLPQDFLMEMMEFNEAIEEVQVAKDDELLKTHLTKINSWKSELAASIQDAVQQYDNDKLSEPTLTKLADYWLKMRYLLRVEQNLTTFAPLS